MMMHFPDIKASIIFKYSRDLGILLWFNVENRNIFEKVHSIDIFQIN
jgi:hypothetical protein